MLYGENKMFPSADLSLSYGASAKSLCPRKPWAARMPGQMPDASWESRAKEESLVGNLCRVRPSWTDQA